METGGTICAVVVIIIIGIGFTAGYIFLKKMIYTGVDSAVDAIRNKNARNREAANPPQQQSLAEKYGMQGTSSPQPISSGINASPSFSKQNVASNQWQCPKCGAVNPRYVGTCGCGFLLSDIEEFERKEKEALKQRMEQARINREEENKKFEEEKKKMFSGYEDINLSSEQEYVIRMLMKESEITIQDMCRKLPRSMNPKQFKDAVLSLEEMGLVSKNEEEKYSLTKKDDNSANEGNSDEVICASCGKKQKKNQLGCIYCHADVTNLVSVTLTSQNENQ